VKHISVILLVGYIFFFLSFEGKAQTKPVNIALFKPVQIFSGNNSIQDLWINFIYGNGWRDLTGDL